MKSVCVLGICVALVSMVRPAAAQDWPSLFDPFQMIDLHLDMSPGDWSTIQNDESLSIQVEASMWTGAETPIQVLVRRKSADPLNNGTSFTKVSLKIDINDLVSGQKWHGVNKLSLENGDDQDVVSEGLAWYLNTLASGPEGYGYPVGMAAWMNVYINGVNTGVYINVEQPNKQFLRNRELYTATQTWLYKVSDVNGRGNRDFGTTDSPAYDALCYLPFTSQCASPAEAAIIADMDAMVDMQGLLTLGATNAFIANGDALFSKGKNFYYCDFLFSTRRYYPWDLDSAIGKSLGADVYRINSHYSNVFLNIPQYRTQYTQLLSNLLCGPWEVSNIHSFLDRVEPVISAALEADPNTQIDSGGVADHFDSLRSWISLRHLEIGLSLEGGVVCTPSCPADINIDGFVDAGDIAEFIDLFLTANPAADMNNDGFLDSGDISTFVEFFLAGC